MLLAWSETQGIAAGMECLIGEKSSGESVRERACSRRNLISLAEGRKKGEKCEGGNQQTQSIFFFFSPGEQRTLRAFSLLSSFLSVFLFSSGERQQRGERSPRAFFVEQRQCDEGVKKERPKKSNQQAKESILPSPPLHPPFLLPFV